MPRSKRQRKQDRIAAYAANLRAHRPDLESHFMCPLCQDTIPTQEVDRISIAHILPRASGGNLTTLLCKRCNSEFGQRQDRWLGDHLKAKRTSGFGRFLELRKDRRFRIQGMPFNGFIQSRDGNSMDVMVDLAQNPPGARDALEALVVSRPHTVSLEIGIPLLRNRHLVPIGFLTSGYLLWFCHFGYSFVLQQHLQPYRDYILSPSPGPAIPYCGSLGWSVPKPVIAVARIDGCFAPLAVIDDMVVIFPPRQRPELMHDRSLGTTIELADARTVSFRFTGLPGCLYALVADDCALVAPDVLGKQATERTGVVYLDTRHNEARMLWPVTPEEAANLQANPDLLGKRSLRIPTPAPPKALDNKDT